MQYERHVAWSAVFAAALATAWLAWPRVPSTLPTRVLYVERVPGMLARVLAARGLAVTETTELPPRLADYDVVIVSDMPAHQLDARVLDAYVTGGGRLIVAGGGDSLGSGGYESTALERLLPVRFASGCRLDAPELALALVIDDSNASKQAASALVESLSPNDIVTVIGAVRPQRAAHRQRILAGIAAAQPVEPRAVLREAGELLESISARRKHVVTLGTVAVDATLAGRGITQSSEHVPLSDDDIRAMFNRLAADDELVHVRGLAAPPLHGYVEMRVKPSAETLYATMSGDPLLARWRHGGGTVIAWTSDADGEWAHDWTAWPGYGAFWVAITSQ